MDVLSTFQRSNKDSVHLFRRNKPVHFGGSLDFLYCMYMESHKNQKFKIKLGTQILGENHLVISLWKTSK